MRPASLAFFLKTFLVSATLAQPQASSDLSVHRPSGTADPIVLMVSFDGMRADYLTDADRYALKIPALRRLMRDGATARRMITIFPSVTYPAHVSLITGEPPARHGIYENEKFQPLVDRQADWHWSARDIEVPTLLQAFQCTGRHTASVDWPVSFGATCDWILPEWWDAGDFSGTFVARLRSAATPGLIEAAEKEFNFTLAMDHIDEHKVLIARHIVRHHAPDLLLLHFEELDKTQHKYGPAVPEVFAALEMLDGLLGELLEEYTRAGLDSRLITCIVADHGFERVDKTFKPNVALREAGLIDYDEQTKCITGWRAKAWISGASAALILADPSDAASLEKARTALTAFTGKPDSPIRRFIEQDEIRRLGSNPRSRLMCDAGAGWMYSRSVAGKVTDRGIMKGMHGQMPDHPELAAAFLIAGAGISKGQSIDRVSILDVAPTIASLAHIALSHTTGRPINELTGGR